MNAVFGSEGGYQIPTKVPAGVTGSIAEPHCPFLDVRRGGIALWPFLAFEQQAGAVHRHQVDFVQRRNQWITDLATRVGDVATIDVPTP